MKYRAIKCPCGHAVCNNWFVDPVAAVQSVRFTEAQARAVAEFLEKFDEGEVKKQTGEVNNG